MKRFNFFVGAAVAAVVLALLVVFAELIGPFKSFLATLFSHHWIGKAVIMPVAFLVAGFVAKEGKKDSVALAKNVTWYGCLGSLGAMLVFYILYFVAA